MRWYLKIWVPSLRFLVFLGQRKSQGLYLHALGPIDEDEELTVYTTLPLVRSEDEERLLTCDADDQQEKEMTTTQTSHEL